MWAVLVMGLSIVLDYWRSRALKRVADKYSSQALQADALHFATDIWSSSVVIAGLGFVWAGRYYHVAWLVKADPIAALWVAGIVVLVSWRLARETLDALLDAAPTGVRNEIIAQVGKRARRAGSGARPYSQGREPLLWRRRRGTGAKCNVPGLRCRGLRGSPAPSRTAGRLRRAGQRRSPRIGSRRTPLIASAPPRCATISRCMTSACRISKATSTSNCTSNSTRP